MPKLVHLISAGVLFIATSHSLAATPILSLWANRGSVDTDGDGVPDLTDIAPGIPDNQADTDADGIGDAIDTNPATTPFLYDIELGIFPSPTILAGNAATIPYIIGSNPPHNPAPGDWGYIDLDFGSDSIYDATWFGPLTITQNSISIPANFFVGAGWDLNTPGTYQFSSLGYAPGTHSLNEAFSSVVVTPEPTTLMALGGVALAIRRRRVISADGESTALSRLR